jgi:hypothetical protein
MVEEFRQQLKGILASFDSISLDDEYKRRLAVKPLYDYFQIILLEVGNQLCDLHRNSLSSCHLEARWVIVKGALEMVEDPSRWNELIRAIYNMRMSTEHSDYSFPSKQSLRDIRKHAVEFADWALEIGKKYHEKSKGFTFLQEYEAISRWFIGQAERIASKLGESPPFCVKEDYELTGNEGSYGRLKELMNTIDSRSRTVRGINELTKEDLSNLIDLVRLIERVEARENFMVAQSMCPRCGGKIVETQKYIGGSEEEAPHAIFYRVGCDKCDYVLDTETIDL